MAFSMIDVGGKQATRRVAVACGRLKMGRAAFQQLKARRLPKGDALTLGEVAGVLAAKNASSTIPLCHPLPLDKVSVRFEFESNAVLARCECVTTAKTGVEMEALAGVTGALLAVYDLVKQVDPELTISDVHLERKEGGKSGVWMPGKKSAKLKLGAASVITVSDTRTKKTDTSGPALASGLKEMGFTVKGPFVVPDQQEAILKAILKTAPKSRLVALTGGTGLSHRDVTPEVVTSLCDRLIPGIGEALRADGAKKLAVASLSRSVAGQLGDTLVVCLPGSRGGVQDALAVLGALLPHALHVMDGGGH